MNYKFFYKYFVKYQNKKHLNINFLLFIVKWGVFMIDSHIKEIRKRDGRIVPFDQDRITDAIFKAAQSVGGKDKELSKKLSDEVVILINQKFTKRDIPTVEEVQDMVEKVLIERGHASTVKSYIIYRQERAKLRAAKSFYLGMKIKTELSLNALKVLEKRYLKKDANGNVIEKPHDMFERVAENIASADKLYDKNANTKQIEKDFFEVMVNLEFLPNSPTLMNAGRPLQQLAGCFVLPVHDSIESIFDSLKYTAIIHQSGGGTGFSFSKIRPRGDVVKSSHGVASGPLSFMRVYNMSTEVIKQGGRRRGANMGILRIDHPDILDFIVCKEKEGAYNNFNISVAITDKFMEAVKTNDTYDLISPHNGLVVEKLKAREVFRLICTMAWKNGEPGVIFIDKLNKYNPTPKLGEIESTNPCGEQPLLPFESCNLGSINLSKVAKDGQIDWDKLRKLVRTCVHYLDNVIDKCRYPLRKIADMVRANRKIGFGVMGFADMLIQLGIPYNSTKAVETAEKVMKFIRIESRKMSEELAKKRGVFPNYKISVYNRPNGPKLRNATLTTIAPTGTISIIAGCSSGIEPLFAISFIRHVLDGAELLEVNPLFEQIAKKQGFYDYTLMKKIAQVGSLHGIEEVPAHIRRIFVTSHDITPEWHVKIQAAFQKYTDNAVSKTVNFRNDATIQDVEKVFMLAYKTGCKGITIYRDKSREEQVLNIGTSRKTVVQSTGKKIPMKKTKKGLTVSAEYAGGCPTCHI